MQNELTWLVHGFGGIILGGRVISAFSVLVAHALWTRSFMLRKLGISGKSFSSKRIAYKLAVQSACITVELIV